MAGSDAVGGMGNTERLLQQLIQTKNAAPTAAAPALSTIYDKLGTLTGNLRYFTTIMADGPAGYWRLDEASGTVAADSSGNGNTGTYTGGVTLGQAGALTGDSDTAITLNNG